MLGRRLTLLTVTALALGLAVGCSRKQPPATDDRPRAEPPPATDTPADADAARRAEVRNQLGYTAADVVVGAQRRNGRGPQVGHAPQPKRRERRG